MCPTCWQSASSSDCTIWAYLVKPFVGKVVDVVSVDGNNPHAGGIADRNIQKQKSEHHLHQISRKLNE